MADPGSARQYLRTCTLLVSNNKGEGLDLSQLHIKFSTKSSDTQTPNTADIRVYNVNAKTEDLIKKEFTQVVLQAGYEGNYGVIFQGNIKQVIVGRESATDTFVDIIAGDGDRAYNFAVVNTSLAKGSTLTDQMNAAMTPMSDNGVTMGKTVGTLPGAKLPRGKVLYGASKNVLRSIADSSGFAWSIQNEKVNFVKQTTYLPGEVVVLTSKTGMIGTPQQTNQGVNVKCLLNPLIKTSGRIQIDNRSVQQLKIDQSAVGSPANTAAPLNADGVYYVLVIEHQGDTRGQEWYSNIVSLQVEVTADALNSVTTGTGE